VGNELVENPVISILETSTAYGENYNVGEKMNKLSSPQPQVFAFKCVYQAVERNEV